MERECDGCHKLITGAYVTDETELFWRGDRASRWHSVDCQQLSWERANEASAFWSDCE